MPSSDENVIGRAGHSLRKLRRELGLTMRDVEMQSEHIANKHNSGEYLIAISRLSDFESKGVLPSIYRFYSLAVILRRDIKELFLWYGLDCSKSFSDLDVCSPPKSHILGL